MHKPQLTRENTMAKAVIADNKLVIIEPLEVGTYYWFSCLCSGLFHL